MNIQPSFWFVLVGSGAVLIAALWLYTAQRSDEDRIRQTLTHAMEALESRDMEGALAYTTEDFSVEGASASPLRMQSGVQRVLDGCHAIEADPNIAAIDISPEDTPPTATVRLSATVWCQSALSNQRVALNDLPPLRGRSDFVIHLRRTSDTWLVSRIANP
ncbi:MAG: hypothetical protein AAFX99_06195 [Myxococcota bacterium]